MTHHAATTAAAILLAAVATVLVGAYGGRLSRTTSDFLVASRTVGPRWNAAAISGEYLSAASFLGVAGLVAKYGATATSSTSSSDGGDRSSTMRTAAGNMGPGGPEGGMPAMEMEAPNAGAANMGEMGGQTTATDSSAPMSVAQGDSGSVMILVQALVTLLEARV